MLDLKNITVSVGSRQLFAADELVLTKGVIALIGRNGTGKSTFIRTLLGEHTNYSGSIRLNGILLKELTAVQKSKLVAVVYSRPQVFGNHTVWDVLALGRLPHQSLFSTVTEQDKKHIDEAARLLQIQMWYNRPFQLLSDGEKQLVMIARALVQDTPLVLMDEPAAFLDVVNRYQLSVLLKKIADETGRLIICSTHQLDRIEQDCDGVLLLADQQLKLLTQNSEFLSVIQRAFGIV